METKYCIVLPPELRQRLKDQKEFLGGRESDIVRKALDKYLTELEQEMHTVEDARKKIEDNTKDLDY
jgi:predicted DNA-binding protein